MKRIGIVFLVVAFLLSIVTLADMGLMPRSIYRLYDFPNGDKLGHFFLMGLANFALGWAWLAARAIPQPAPVILKVSLIFALFVTLEELSQQFFPRRTFSLLDLACSYAGIALFGVFLVWLERKKRRG